MYPSIFDPLHLNVEGYALEVGCMYPSIFDLLHRSSAGTPTRWAVCTFQFVPLTPSIGRSFRCFGLYVPFNLRPLTQGFPWGRYRVGCMYPSIFDLLHLPMATDGHVHRCMYPSIYDLLHQRAVNYQLYAPFNLRPLTPKEFGSIYM